MIKKLLCKVKEHYSFDCTENRQCERCGEFMFNEAQRAEIKENPYLLVKYLLQSGRYSFSEESYKSFYNLDKNWISQDA